MTADEVTLKEDVTEEWRALRHAYGSAEEVPELLNTLEQPQEAAQALGKLRGLLLHQGNTLYSASIAALPYLVRHASTLRSPIRQEAVRLIGELAAVARLSPGDAEISRSWHQAWVTGLPELLALLTDSDSAIRREAAFLLGRSNIAFDEIADALMRLESSSTGQAELISRLMGIAELGQRLSFQKRIEVLHWIDDLPSEGLPQLRLAAILASLRLRPGQLDFGETNDMFTALAGADVSVWRKTPCLPGPNASLVTWVDGELAPFVERRLDLISRLALHSVPKNRLEAVQAALRIMYAWRNRASEIADAVSALVEDNHVAVRRYACYAAALCAKESGGHAEALERRARADSDELVSGMAIWALGRIGNEHFFDTLAERFARDGSTGFPSRSGSGGWNPSPSLPTLHEIMALGKHGADRLLPAVRDRLRNDSAPGEIKEILIGLAGWGDKAATITSDVLPLLEGPNVIWAMEVLVAAGNRLDVNMERQLRRTILTSDLSEPEKLRSAVSHWKITGSTELVEKILLPHFWRGTFALDCVRLIGELGLDAHEYVPLLRRELPRSAEPWRTAITARALRKISGDAESSVPALSRILQQVVYGEGVTRAELLVLQELIEAGRAPQMNEGDLIWLGHDDRRYTGGSGWRWLTLDEDFAACVREVSKYL